jgi:hypothetical protein
MRNGKISIAFILTEEVNALRNGARRKKMASCSMSLVFNYSSEHRTYNIRDRELNQSWRS